MSFQHLEISENWTDFTLETPIEEAISTVENIFDKWSKPIKTIAKSRFGFKGYYYFLHYVPNNFYGTNQIQEYLHCPQSTIDIIRAVFGIQSNFVYVTSEDENKNSINTKSIEPILSILRPAASSKQFSLPIFVLISKPEYYTFYGFSINKKIHTFYLSRMDFQQSPPFQSLQTVQETFKSLPVNINLIDVTSSYRLQLNLNEDSFFASKIFHYRYESFFSSMPDDPIKSFFVTIDFNHPIKSINVIDASNICIAIKRIKSLYNKANTYFFVEQLKNSIKYKSWKELLPNSLTNAKNKILKLFADCEAHNDDVESYRSKKSILKAAPENSLLCKFLEILVNLESLSDFSALWNEFLFELRRRLDNHLYIPGVSKNGPDLDNCLIQQKLEMLNICVTKFNTDEKVDEDEPESTKSDKVLLDGTPMVYPKTQEAPARTEDQIFNHELLLEKNSDDAREKAILQSDQLKSDMSAFKFYNPTAQFEDFIYWYSPADFDPKEKKLSARMSLEDNLWRELWDSAKSEKTGKALFNPTEQSELALDFLESLSPAELLGDLIPVLLATIYFKVKGLNLKVNAIKNAFTEIETQLKLFHQEVESNTSTVPFDDYASLSGDICSTIEELMLDVHSANSLLLKTGNNELAVNQLMEFGVHFVSDQEERDNISKLMDKIGINLSNPSNTFVHSKQYIINGYKLENNIRYQQRVAVLDYIDRVVIADQLQESL